MKKIILFVLIIFIGIGVMLKCGNFEKNLSEYENQEEISQEEKEEYEIISEKVELVCRTQRFEDRYESKLSKEEITPKKLVEELIEITGVVAYVNEVVVKDGICYVDFTKEAYPYKELSYFSYMKYYTEIEGEMLVNFISSIHVTLEETYGCPVRFSAEGENFGTEHITYGKDIDVYPVQVWGEDTYERVDRTVEAFYIDEEYGYQYIYRNTESLTVSEALDYINDSWYYTKINRVEQQGENVYIDISSVDSPLFDGIKDVIPESVDEEEEKTIQAKYILQLLRHYSKTLTVNEGYGIKNIYFTLDGEEKEFANVNFSKTVPFTNY